MRKLAFLLSLAFLIGGYGSSLAQTTLAAGDIAFIGKNFDGSDDYAFVLLKDVDAATTITFTDCGWSDGTSSFVCHPGDANGWIWTAGSALTCGTIVTITNETAASPGSMSGTPSLLSSAGDQILAYQGSAATPTFIAAFNSNSGGNDADWDGSVANNQMSQLPDQLTNGVNAIRLHNGGAEQDNWQYNCAVVSGDVATVRAAINNVANWTPNDGTAFSPVAPACAWSITCAPACSDPDVPTVTYTPAVVCSGNNATLNISGNLNDATNWHIYTGSCGGSLVGTTNTGSFVVTPAGPSTTYYVRGEGGCVTPGSCGQVTVTVTNPDDASFSYSASSYCVDDSDPTPTVTGLGGGGFTSSPVGLNINPSSGLIDVSTSVPGTYTVTYTTTGPCPNSSNVAVTINALDDPSFSYSASSYCVDDSDPTPTVTGLGGGGFTSTPVGLSLNPTSGAIDVSLSTPGTYTVTYTTTGSCPNASNVAVTINALDDPSFSYSAASYCVDDSDPTPTITGLGGGGFTSSPVGLNINPTSGAIDVSASTPGTYTVTYTTTGTCPNSSNVAVTVNALDDASFSYSASAYCVDDSDPTPTITGLGGGGFTSTPLGLNLNPTSGAIDVSLSTPGTYTVTYTTTGACPNSSNVAVTINALDDASFSYSAASYCVDAADPTPTVTGLGGGGFTSSPVGLNINPTSGAIDVSASTPGTYTVTYTTTGICPNASNVAVTINALDDASFSYAAASYCVDAADPTPTITGLGGGGFTSSPVGLNINPTSGAIDVSASTPGTYTVTYTTTGLCPNASNVAVTINALDDPSFSYSAASYCTNDSDPSPTVTGLGGGGFTSSPVGLNINPTSGAIDVSASTPGSYTVTYTTTGSCPNASNVAITINAQDDASFSYSAASYCVDASDPTPTVTGLGGGGFTSSPVGLNLNPTSGVIDVSASTPGTYTVTYTTMGSCPNSSNVAVTINALDDASFSYSAAAYCADASDPTPTVTGLGGGGFTSSPVGLNLNPTSGAIDVSASTPGTYTVTYTTTGSCPNSSNVNVTINTVPTEPTVTTPIDICPGVDVVLEGTGSGTGDVVYYDDVFTEIGRVTMPPGVTTHNIGPLASGTYTCYAAEDNGACVSSLATIIINVVDNTDPVTPTISNVTSECSVTLTTPTTTDDCAGTVTGTTTDPTAYNAVGVYTVNWEFNDGNGNSITVPQTVTIEDNTDPDMPTLPTVTGQCSATAAAPTTTDNCAGTITGTTTDPVTYTAQGTYTITWTFDDGNGNSVTADQTVVVDDITAPAFVQAFLPDATGECSIDAPPVVPQAWDACDGTIMATTSTTFPITAQGTTVVTWEYTDSQGNTSMQTQNFVVQDVTSPILDVPSLENLVGFCSVMPTIPTATDNCAGTVNGVADVALPVTNPGATTITWSFDDGSGNVVTQTQIVSVNGIDVSTTIMGYGAIRANNGGETYQWIDCSDNSEIAGETGQEYVPTANGSYAVIITEGTCTDTSECVNINNAGIDNLGTAPIKVYPNPTVDGKFKIQLDAELKSIEVLDMLGRSLELPTDLNEGTVDGTSLSKGKYIVKVSTQTDQVYLTEIVIIK